MLGTGYAAAQGNFGKMQFIYSQFRYADRGGDDVDDGIGGADFVKMHLIDGDAMNLRFRLGESGENIDGSLL